MSISANYENPTLLAPNGTLPHLTTQSSEQAWFYAGSAVCFVVFAFLFLVSMTIISRQLVAEGIAVHMWNLQTKHFIKMQYWLYITRILYAPGMVFTKIAILLQYLRLLAPTKTTNPVLFFGAHAIIAIVIIYNVIVTAITIFACTPREKFWNPLITGGHCLDQRIAVLINSLFNIISDVAILVLPVRTIWKLQIPRRKRIGIILLFATGLIAYIANIMVIYYLAHMAMSGASADWSYNAAWLSLWSYAELSLGIIVICTLSMPKFVEAEGERIRRACRHITNPLSRFESFSLRSTQVDQSAASETTTRSGTGLEGVSVDGIEKEVGRMV